MSAATDRKAVGQMAYVRVEAKRQADPWRQIEHEAREQVRRDVEAEEAQPLALGSAVAWAKYCHGWTDSLSPVHRVGEPIQGQAMTLCGDVIPCAMMRLPLSPDLVRTLPRCRYCEASYMQKGNAA